MYLSKRSLVIAFVFIGALSSNGFAQGRRAGQAKGKLRAKVAQAKPPCRSGDFIERIDANATGSFTVPICIAAHSPVVIELPASDPFYAHHPGDEKFVTIDPRSKTTDPLVIRPGDGFFIEPGRVRPSSVVSVQMTSGLVGSFLIYAIEDVASNNSHVIVAYDREEVIKARRRLGLRADLVPAEVLASYLSEAPAQVQTSTPGETPRPAVRVMPRSSASSEASHVPAHESGARVVPISLSEQAVPIVQAQSFSASSLPASASLPSLKADAGSGAPTTVADVVDMPAGDSKDIEAATRDELLRVSNGKGSLRFGKAVHGLALAVSRSRFVMAGYRIEVVAVRNSLSEPLRLVPGQPEIYVETMHEGQAINAPRLEPRTSVSTLPSGEMLAPGATYYFAFAFDEPILGVKDFLRVSVAQTNAADEPVSASLITAAR